MKKNSPNSSLFGSFNMRESAQDVAPIYIDVRQAFLCIARGLDLVGIDDVHHGHRVAYTAYECAKKMLWSPEKSERAFYSGLLHDCGVSTTSEHKQLLQKMQPKDVNYHCDRGYEALQSNHLLKSFAPIVRYHHGSDDELEKLDIQQDDKDIAGLIHLSDRVDFLRSTYVKVDHSEVVMHKHSIIGQLENKQAIFNPLFLEYMIKTISVDGFWFSMEYENIERICLNFSHYQPFEQYLHLSELMDLAHFLAHIVDSKSSYTFNHSEKVAKLSKELAQDMGMDKESCTQIYIAGLVHDLGKLRVPDDILYKADKLTDSETAMIKRHAADTLNILQQLLPNNPIAAWAGNHHEKLNGTGYPYHLEGEQLDLGSRIVAIADVFQALSQSRPYKSRMKLEDVLSILSAMVDKNELDHHVFEKLMNRKDHYFEISTG